MKRYLTTFGLLVAISLHAQDKPLTFKGALIYTVAGPPIQYGTLIIHKGKIVKTGPANTTIPADATIVNATGKVIMPRLVDSHDFILSGDPFSIYTKIEQTWVEGNKRWDILNPKDKAF